MRADVLRDNNIVVDAPTERDPRSTRAMKRLRAGGRISVQVLSPFAIVARRKLGRSWPDIEAVLDLERVLFPVPAPFTADTHRTVLRIARLVRVAFDDAPIVATALE